MPNFKSTGSEGNPIELYKVFWNHIEFILVKYFDYYFIMGYWQLAKGVVLPP